MTADPGTYDVTPADLALEREDAADEAKVQAWREAKADDYLLPGEYTSRLDRAAFVLQRLTNADRVIRAAQEWRAIELRGEYETDAWHDAKARLGDVCDRYLDHVNGRAS